MSNNFQVNRLRAFVNDKGEYGNPTGIILDVEHKIGKADRQKIATQLHFTDSVFINSLDPVNISFFNPEQETKFAGDALISTSHFLKNVLMSEVKSIVCRGGRINTWVEGELTWIESTLNGTPGWNHLQLLSAEAVDAITPNEAEEFEHTMVWAWDDEKNGIVKSRTFLLDWGTLEDQGNGSGSMQLAVKIGRELKINQGEGSVIFARPSGSDMAQVGGRVSVDLPILINI